ncbi:hypothetical protein [Spiroplasma taiwanense]|uniref:Transmembrane protein n=1 Tax=Spiroplasma taiwanense CT-1 TaxID=1276220 RepID=S5LW43_9MOLU|nr:hypothetical protein [Spiroplasma taiwanense]AGR40816.1 hypothetical protein STAIW_v1c01300 [Spiroplasma taiwanense CT-1]
MLSTRQGILSVIIGTTISLFNAIIQFLTIYWVLNAYGTEFNGYIRLVSSFSTIISVAEGSLGVAATILLVKPLVQNDWISANEIYSTAKKYFKKSALISLFMVLIISLGYPLYVGISANSTGTILNPKNWNDIGLNLSNQGEKIGFASYYILVLISLIFGTKNFVSAYWFSVYETIIIADNKNSVRRIVILFADIFISGITFYLLSIKGINPIIPFLPTILYSPIKGFMIYFYVKKKYLWLKYYKDFNSFKLNTTSNKIFFSTIGPTLLLNTDIAIAAILLGLNVSSSLSLYLVVALNTKLIMTNFIVSFREFFVTLVTKRGRIHWESYAKYELYTYLVAAFTFINMSILAPYFVSSLYGELASSSISNDDFASINALDFMFYTSKFSILYASIALLAILCDAQMTLIHAKGRYGEVSKFQNIVGVLYLLTAIFITFLIVTLKIGGEQNYLVTGIIVLFSLKLLFMFIRYIYLWIYVWKYATYNSNKKYIFNNFLILFLPVILTILLNVLVINKKLDIRESTSASASIAPLIALFFGAIILSLIILVIFAYICAPKIMNEIMQRLPLINKIFLKKSVEARKKRLKKYGIEAEDIVDNSNKITHLMIDIDEVEPIIELGTELKLDINSQNENIYIVKGK